MSEYYREHIVEMVNKIHSEKLLRRIYSLAEYLYVYLDENGTNSQSTSATMMV